MNQLTFADLVGDPAPFFAHYFRREPMYRHAPLAGAVSQILSVEQMSDVIEMEAMRPAYLRLTQARRPLSPKRFTRLVVRPGTMTDSVVDAEGVFALFHDGATITVNALDHFVPSVRPALRAVTDQFGCHGEAVAFLTPPNSPGFAPHTDPVDIFVVQMAGTKVWSIWNRSDDTGRARPEDLAGLLGEPDAQLTLSAGDVLYLPPRTPHAASAHADTSLHVGLSVEPRSWRALMHECVDALLDETTREAPYVGPELRSDAVATLASYLTRLGGELSALDAQTELLRLVGGTTARRRFEAAVG